MTSFSIEFTKSAKKEFSKLPPKMQDRVIESLQLLAVNPFSELLKMKKLKGEDNLFRIRTGDYRIIYEIKKQSLLILVIKIGHRREVYKDN